MKKLIQVLRDRRGESMVEILVSTVVFMLLLGALVEKTGCVRFDSIAPALHKVIPARKADLFDVNMKAVEAGKAYQG